MNIQKIEKEGIIKKLINLFKKDSKIKDKDSTSNMNEELTHHYLEIMAPPYGIITIEDWAMVKEIERRRQNRISMEDLYWPDSNDPLAPANNVKHPYYIYHSQ